MWCTESYAGKSGVPIHLERLDKEIKPRNGVVGVCPTRPPCFGRPARCSSKPTTNGTSRTNGTRPKMLAPLLSPVTWRVTTPTLPPLSGETTGSARQIQDRRAAGHPCGGRHIDE